MSSDQKIEVFKCVCLECTPEFDDYSSGWYCTYCGGQIPEYIVNERLGAQQ